jgi:hypothetical protein
VTGFTPISGGDVVSDPVKKDFLVSCSFAVEEFHGNFPWGYDTDDSPIVVSTYEPLVSIGNVKVSFVVEKCAVGQSLSLVAIGGFAGLFLFKNCIVCLLNDFVVRDFCCIRVESKKDIPFFNLLYSEWTAVFWYGEIVEGLVLLFLLFGSLFLEMVGGFGLSCVCYTKCVDSNARVGASANTASKMGNYSRVTDGRGSRE